MRTSVYYLSKLTVDYILYLFIVLPSIVMTGVDSNFIDVLSENGIVIDLQRVLLVEIMTKAAFSIILLSSTYLIGFLLNNSSVNIIKNLGFILLFFGHLLNMILLDLYNFNHLDLGALAVINVGMINPFTFNFFNSRANYFFLEIYSPDEILEMQKYYSVFHVVFGIVTLIVLVYLEERSFKMIIKLSSKKSLIKEDILDNSTVDGDLMIKVRNVSKAYSGSKHNTVNDISLNIKENEIIGILGASGAGKSTVFKMVTMALNRSSGSIEMIG